MKKIISLILSIALFATLMPTILVSAEETTASVDVVADVAMTYNASDYSSESHIWRSASTSTRPLLYKLDFSNIEIPAGKEITKVELYLNILPSTQDVDWRGKTTNANLYHVTGTWDQTTVSVSDFTGTSDGLSPALGLADNGCYAHPTVASPDAVVPLSCESAPTSNHLLTLDITPIFRKQFPIGQIGTDSEMSFLMVSTNVGYNHYWKIATLECSDKTAVPTAKVTFGDIPMATVVSESVPSNPVDNFSLTLGSNITNATATVNGVNADSNISWSDDTFILDYDFDVSTEYSVDVDITCTDGSKHTKTYTFTTNDGTDTSKTIKLYITEDAVIPFENSYAGLADDYGSYAGGSDASYYLKSAKSTSRAYAVHKVPLTGVSDMLEAGNNTISKVEFSGYIVGLINTNNAYGVGSIGQTNTMNIYPASTGWDEDTITYDLWETNGFSPAMTSPGTGDYGYAVIDETITPSVTSYTFPEIASDGAPQLATFDATLAFKTALSDGIEADSVFSFMTALGNNSSYTSWVNFASSEYADTQYRPYITVTVDDKETETQTASEFYSYTINTGTTTPVLEKSGTVYVLRNNSKESGTNYDYNCTVLMKFALTNDYYDEFAVTYTSAGEPTVHRIYGFDNDNGISGANLVYEDLDATLYDSTKLIGAPSYEDKVCTIDVADYANECVANGKSAMYLLIGTDGNTSSISKILPTAVAKKAVEPTITFTGSTPAVAGSYIKSIDAKFSTVLDNDAANLVELYKGTTKVEDVTFVSKGNTIDFAAPTKLEENTSYTVVLKAGATDLFGDTTTEDIEIAAFTTGYDFVNYGIKLFAKDTEVEKDAFATTDGLAAATAGAEVQGYWRADNNAIEEKALIIAIGAYNDDNELLGVQFSAFEANDEESKIYKTNALTVPTGATKIKAFGWDGTSQAAIAFAEIPVR